MTHHPSAALDFLDASGAELGAAVAVVRAGVVEVDHAAGTSDGTRPWAPTRW